MTSKIIFSTESGAELPEDLKLKYNIQIVPMHVIMDGKDYLDGTLPVQEIYSCSSLFKKLQLFSPRLLTLFRFFIIKLFIRS